MTNNIFLLSCLMSTKMLIPSGDDCKPFEARL